MYSQVAFKVHWNTQRASFDRVGVRGGVRCSQTPAILSPHGCSLRTMVLFLLGITAPMGTACTTLKVQFRIFSSEDTYCFAAWTPDNGQQHRQTCHVSG